MVARIAIRVDGSHRVGMGHVYRMAHLAEALRLGEIGEIRFYCRTDKAVAAWLKQFDFDLRIFSADGDTSSPADNFLPVEPVDLLINDILDTSLRYMVEACRIGCRIINLDDNGPGSRLADCCINALPCKMLDRDVRHVSCQGPDFLLLNKEFTPRVPLSVISRVPSSILVTLGGSDTYGNTLSAAVALRKIGQLKKVEVVTGPAFGHGEALAEISAVDPRFVVRATVPSLAEVMRKHELAIVGGGITLFEAAACGLPTLAIASEDFERANIEWAEAGGITRSAGGGKPADSADLLRSVQNLLGDWEARCAMQKLGPQLVDGKGMQRIVELIRDYCS